ncbi:4-(cytidine 5'-diphospho)-2-C-methyl-D-erythritol kinase [Chitinivibrio alkaliphilus]|uniref:4-diphosphocytidyl-2-C-methyl-D-erythritol kinase n=1 Tax=Chitinivibrio alkaliphilus ACht1 TaxID=1313304 RepID=U7D6M8_9BACT|nr:4-(cytidine 5'-diphospho)-2-C-methyl-D-erythritol kinase [Chitinivibrio alkaliphilus]ERP31593.1 4-diphosphocytidyl-2C-methyl-D-erythritol kinase [Chitinivibrio alkaliphilus ACht1]
MPNNSAVQEKSYTRITLALDIIGKITHGPLAGYHEMGIVKHQIDLADTITLTPAEETRLTCTDSRVPCDETNLCIAVLRFMQDRYKHPQEYHIELEKNIPVQGGLAGGSANAATMINLLNTAWELSLSPAEKMAIGGAFGMDIPYYFLGKTAFDSETTGTLTAIPTECTFSFVLVIPPFGIATARAYKELIYPLCGKEIKNTEALIKALERNEYREMAPLFHNDFQKCIIQKEPRISQITTALREAGCCASFLSGSGSTVVGIAQNRAHAHNVAELFPHAIVAETLI